MKNTKLIQRIFITLKDKHEAEKIIKSDNLKWHGIPCVDCLVLPICNSIIGSSLYSADSITISKLYARCESLRRFINVYANDDKGYTNIGIDVDKLELVAAYFKEIRKGT